MKRFILTSVLALLAAFLCAGSAFAAGGSCPSGANYIDLTNPANGGGNGSVTLASLGVTSCYYISAAGSDTNSGTSEATPWLHAPGMPACSGTCASTTPAAGNGFIFRGGDSWHRNKGTPLIGGDWTWDQGGSKGNPIYIGVDVTWFSGSSFARPIFNQDNPPSTNPVGSCPFPDDATFFFTIDGSFDILDGFEFTGNCMSSTNANNGGDSSVVETENGTSLTVERSYVHGWSMTANVADDGGVKFGYIDNPTSVNRFLFDVVDGSDSTYGTNCTTPSCVSSGLATGWAFGDGYDVEYSVVRHVSNGIQAGSICILNGNLLEYVFEPTISGRHGNVVEQNFGSCNNGVYYNNVTRHVDTGINWITNDLNFYIFNNVWFDDQHFPPDPNGYLLCGGGSGSNVATAYFYNNTMQDITVGSCSPGTDGGGWSAGSSITYGNNHIMDFTSAAGSFSCAPGSTCAVKDNGGEVFQTTSAAEAQGYTYANNWAPTTATDATVAAGKNLTTTFCSTVAGVNAAAGAACKSGTSGAVTEVSAWGGQFASYPTIAANARPSSGAWDAGAYQFDFGSGSSSGKPAPPTGLNAVVK